MKPLDLIWASSLGQVGLPEPIQNKQERLDSVERIESFFVAHQSAVNVSELTSHSFWSSLYEGK